MQKPQPSRQAHWEKVYGEKPADAVSWYEPTPAVSLALLKAAGHTAAHSLIDIGAGASRLVDALHAQGSTDLAVLDIAATALETTKSRLAGAEGIDFIVADITAWQPDRTYDFWHDRAVFHFLTAAEDRAAYARAFDRALPPGGVAVIGTFAPDGPEQCSGLDVQRHDGASIAAALGEGFTLVSERRHLHATPWGRQQAFTFATLRKVGL